ncbi:hypothetical protein ACFLXT_04680 [Chloroflexota bacterium]
MDGYQELLEVISDSEHEGYLDTMTWLGGCLDLEAFDLKTVNNKLRSVRV